MTAMPPQSVLTWCAIGLAAAVVMTFFINKIRVMAERTLPTWTLAFASQHMAKTYPGKPLAQVIDLLAKRDRVFSMVMKVFPWQALIGLLLFAWLWKSAGRGQSGLAWFSQNMFTFEFMMLAFYPMLRMLQTIQGLTLARIRELYLKK